MHEFHMLRSESCGKLEIEQIQYNFQDAFAKIWLKKVENDYFNSLILSAALNIEDIIILRAYAKYFHQLRLSFSENYIATTLHLNPKITKLLINYFHYKFEFQLKDQHEYLATIEDNILKLLINVENLDEDRILQQYLDTIKATVRTNAFLNLNNATQNLVLALKIKSSLLKNIPLPKPLYEIYIYDVNVEGIHLRGDKISRGGIRWSDRKEDFRTEVLGLMKAQQVKNACIVPLGAKGGFIVKNLTNKKQEITREEITNAAIKSYKIFIHALLSITDNIINNNIVRPKDLIIWDEDDSYLVVAADKGTASFSNFSNEIAVKNNFWLQDAFASGSDTGYDHKKMGITAKGAWESVKRHFIELKIDIKINKFTVIGIGDMSGDVFGNGMLLSKNLLLLAAFDHRHIFIDPSPNAEISYQERKRLFNLKRSTWLDYDKDILSNGGAVFNRKSKSIKLSPEIQNLLKLSVENITPNELIKNILIMKVHLLWNGGVGTFVKSSNESNINVGDRNNDIIRINANELKCSIVGEGGNLGFTQLARIEYELNGGKINADFIDNLAGVNCSDHEVNIKILLRKAMLDNKIDIIKRNQIMHSMINDVEKLVLHDNYQQALAISLASYSMSKHIDFYIRYVNQLTEEIKLDAKLEFLPDEKELLQRKANSNKGLTRPELAVLFAYSKISLKEKLINSSVPEGPYLSKMLQQEFPKLIKLDYLEEMQNHPLKREIIVTQISNLLINEMGFSFIPKLQLETGESVANIVRAFTISRNIFGKKNLLANITKLDLQISSKMQFRMMLILNRLTRRATRWFLKNRIHNLYIDIQVAEFTKLTEYLTNKIIHILPKNDLKHYSEQLNYFVKNGVPEKLASKIASCDNLLSSLEILEICLQQELSIEAVAKLYYSLGDKLELNWLRNKVTNIKPKDTWEDLLRTKLLDEIDWWQRQLLLDIIQKYTTDENCINNWFESHQKIINKWEETKKHLKSSVVVNSIMLTVSVQEFSNMVQKYS